VEIKRAVNEREVEPRRLQRFWSWLS